MMTSISYALYPVHTQSFKPENKKTGFRMRFREYISSLMRPADRERGSNVIHFEGGVWE